MRMEQTQQESVRLNDLFWTIQGEGKNWGKRSLFVRMPFCNLACSWCDTTYNTFKKVTLDELKEFALQEKSRYAVITGGEPMMNKDTPKVIQLLQSLGFIISCESNGSFPILNGIDFATVSPKRDNDYAIHEQNIHRCDEIKVVVDDGFDFEVLKKLPMYLKPGGRLSLSPEFNNMEESVKKIEQFMKDGDGTWELNLQCHKWINLK